MTRLTLNIRRWIILIAVALIASALAGPPSALAQDGKPPEPPVEEPTKAAPPPEEEKTPTPLPGQEAIKTPTPFEAAKTPTGSPPSLTATPTIEPTSLPTATATALRPTPHTDPVRTIPPTPHGDPVTGVVFDDADGDGQRDPDEPGLPGVPVAVSDGSDGTRTIVTDASGAYALTAAPDTTLRVIPPAGWRAPGLAARPASRAGDFPLRRLIDAQPAAVSLTQSALDLSGIVIGFAALGLIGWLALAAHRRALVRSFEAWALADLRLRHEAQREARRFEVAADDQALQLLEQAALDASGARPGLTHLMRDYTGLAPVAAIAAFSAGDGRRWVFSPASPDQMQRLERQTRAALFGRDGRRWQHHVVDALNSSPFIADNLAAVLRYLVEDSASPLPRAEQWHVYGVEQRQRRG
jgi:hypothetical protein